MDNNIRDGLNKLEENLDKLANITKAKFTKSLSRENVMIIMIDIQEKLSPAMNNESDIIKNSKIILEMARVLDIPVIVTEQYPNGLGSTLEELKEYYTDRTRVYDKVSFSALRTESIRETIEKINRPNVIIFGIETHICVYQTVKDLLVKGYNTYVPIDAVGSRTKENNDNGLELMRDFGARVSNVETILFELLEKAGTDEFKQLSPLIK